LSRAETLSDPHRLGFLPAFQLFATFITLILPQFPKGKKPTVGFLARFFGKGRARRKSLRARGLREKKARKSEKAQKK
jgi:hypothetical protein